MKKSFFIIAFLAFFTGLATAQVVVYVNSPFICSGTTAQLTATAYGGAPPYTYLWDTGDTTASIFVTPVITTTYHVTVSDQTAFPYTAQGTVTVEYYPAQPSPVSGNNNPCEGSVLTYCVTNVPGMIYVWIVPADWTITAGQGTNCITVTVGAAAGIITVTPSNSCGNGAPQTLSVTAEPLPSQPDSISGNYFPCPGDTETYCTTNVPGTTNTWTVPSGWVITAGQGTNCITVLVGSLSGGILVTPSNICGNGPVRYVFVNPNCLSGADELTGQEGGSLEIFPNPAGDEMNIMFSIADAATLQLNVFSISGQTIHTEKIGNFSGTYSGSLDLKEFPEGVYFIQVISEKAAMLKKVVVMR
jgi:hypothetical protein